MVSKQHEQSNIGLKWIQLSCEECCQTIPYNDESADYVAYFCGLVCYQKWEGKVHSLNKQEHQNW